MKWLPSGLGAEPKKLIALAVLLAAVPAVYYYNSQPDLPPGVATRPAPGPSAPTAPATQSRPAARRPAPARVNEDFRPTLILPENFDLSSINPTLDLDLLARVRAVDAVGGKRSLFEFYTPPPLPAKVEPIKPEPPKPVETPKPVVATTPLKPQPPAIPLKFYGYSGAPRDGKLRALLVDGEETFVVAPGDLIRNRYKMIRVGVATVEVEDTTAKSTQTLQILPKCDDKDDTRCKQP